MSNVICVFMGFALGFFTAALMRAAKEEKK